MNTRTVSAVLPFWIAEAEALKAQALDRLEHMSPQDRDAVPAPDAWSAAQVVAHLVRVEELTAGEWRAAALASPSARPSRRGAMMVSMINAAMKTPLRIPTRSFLEPDGGTSLAELSARWETVRVRLPATLPPDPAALWIIHSIFGPLSGAAMGAFLVAHLRHHLSHWPAKGKA